MGTNKTNKFTMRPYAENQNGKTPKKNRRRGEKAMNGVKKSLVKAKVSAVKTSRKLQASNKEEVEDLLDQTANGQPSTPVGKAVVANAANGTSKPMKKLKSLVNVTERKS